MLLKIRKDVSFNTKVDFIMNSLILSAELFWSVFSWSIPSKAILNQDLLMSMQCTEPLCTEGTVHEFSIFRLLPIHVFFKMLKNCHSLLFPFLFLGGRRAKQSEKTLVIWELFPAPGPSSSLAIRKTSLFSVQIIYTQDPLNALTLPLLLKICILNRIFALSLIC